MKISKIIPIFKKGDSEDVNNYRPIAVTSAFSKVYEQIFLARLEHHLKSNNYIVENQHGFQKGKSTVTALFNFVEKMYSSLEDKAKLNAIFV